MSGDEHYKEAERLVDAWYQGIDSQSSKSAREMKAEVDSAHNFLSQTLAAAQVHATLALAAATAEAAGSTCPHGTRGFCTYCALPLLERACRTEAMTDLTSLRIAEERVEWGVDLTSYISERANREEAEESARYFNGVWPDEAPHRVVSRRVITTEWAEVDE